MAKKPTIGTISSGYASTTALNSNFEALRNGFDNTLSLDGSTPNAMQADLDMNSNDILNAGRILVGGVDYVADAKAARDAALAAQTAAELAETNAETAETNAKASETAAQASETAAGTSATNAASSASSAASSASTATTQAGVATTKASEASASASAAATSESNAATSETNAATSATNAATSETNAAASASSAQASKDAALAALDNFDDRYLGQKASDPTLDNDGGPLVTGSLYFNTTDDVMKVYEGAVWVAAYASLSGALLQANNLSDVLDVAASRTNLGLGTGNTPTFAGINTTGNATFGDNDKAIFGAGNDLQIFALSGNSYISEGGAGSLSIRAADLLLRSPTDENYVVASNNGAVTLYHDNAAKLATTSTGINVTGTVTADGLTVDGQAVIGDGVVGSSNLTNLTSGTPPQLVAGWSIPAVSWTPSSATEAVFTRDGNMQVDILAGANNFSNINFSDPDDEDVGQISYDHSTDAMRFRTSGGERLRVTASGNVGIGKTNPSTALDVTGTVTATAFVGDGSSLTGIDAGATGGGSDKIFWENGQTVTTNYTITDGQNAMSAGPITINSGVTVTVGAGEVWTVI